MLSNMMGILWVLAYAYPFIHREQDQIIRTDKKKKIGMKSTLDPMEFQSIAPYNKIFSYR